MTADGAPRGTIIKTAEVDARFGDGSLFKHSAYRLELLDEYDSPKTRLRVARFLAGQPDDAEVRAYWDRVVGEARRAGKTMQRVHVITEPLTDYLRFELAFYRGSVLGQGCYLHTAASVAVAEGVIRIRDSKNRDGGLIACTDQIWRSFTSAIKRGEFELPEV
jgi:Domain of unknown function (DUF397)